MARIEAVEGGVVREEDLKGALDGGGGEDAADGADAAGEADDESPAEPVDQSKIDYQLARALDLIRGVAVFGALETRIMTDMPYDERGYRPCVGIFLLNEANLLFAGRGSTTAPRHGRCRRAVSTMADR